MSDEKVDLLYQSKRSLVDGLNERDEVSKSERHWVSRLVDARASRAKKSSC